MLRQFAVVIAGLICLAMSASLAYAQTAQAATKKDPKELVLRLKNTSVEDLAKLSFLELNVLKNAIFASRGYRFANDRPWLNEIFCRANEKKTAKKNVKPLSGSKDLPRPASDADVPGSLWSLTAYAFPVCAESGPVNEDQKMAIANIRVALFKKIDAIGNVRALDSTLDEELRKIPQTGGSAWILGKTLSKNALRQYGTVSMRRDLHGMNRMLHIMKNLDDFDSMELLGLFMGDIIFLRNVIEAKQGKEFTGVQGWEISQLIGVPPVRGDYTIQKLPPAVQMKLKALEDIAVKIQRSDLNDVPASFKNKPIEFNDPYDLEGC